MAKASAYYGTLQTIFKFQKLLKISLCGNRQLKNKGLDFPILDSASHHILKNVKFKQAHSALH
uniref:Uncharacterized protein n=1 Tax=Oryza glumipatula TaxID=40148 RepID=A0A0D9Y923_9ORYZ